MTSGAELVQPAGDGTGDVVLAAFGRELVEWAEVCSGDVVLDLGAGQGAVTLAALRQVGARGRVVAVDVAAELAGMLTPQRSSGRLRTVAMEDAGDELVAERFDSVLCGFGLHVMVNPAVLLAEVYRVLRPGGRLAFSVPGPCADGGWWDHFAALAEEYRWRVTVPSDVDVAAPLAWLASRLGFADVERVSREVHVPVSGPFGYWEWLLAHGNRWLYDALAPAERTEFRARVLRDLARRHPDRGHTVDAGAWLYRMTKPRTTTALMPQQRGPEVTGGGRGPR